MPPRDDAWLIDIVQSARFILKFTAGMDRASFDADEKTQSAVIHKIQVIGEATKRLSEEFKMQHTHVPWRKISRMRDMLIHHYDRVNLDEVWLVVSRDAAELIKMIEPLAPPPQSGFMGQAP